MELLPQSILDQLAANGRANQAHLEAGEDTIDHPRWSNSSLQTAAPPGS